VFKNETRLSISTKGEQVNIPIGFALSKIVYPRVLRYEVFSGHHDALIRFHYCWVDPYLAQWANEKILFIEVFLVSLRVCPILLYFEMARDNGLFVGHSTLDQDWLYHEAIRDGAP